MLDYVFINELLLPVARYDIVHVNVDYPCINDSLVSEHAQSLIRINLRKCIPADYDDDRYRSDRDCCSRRQVLADW